MKQNKLQQNPRASTAKPSMPKPGTLNPNLEPYNPEPSKLWRTLKRVDLGGLQRSKCLRTPGISHQPWAKADDFTGPDDDEGLGNLGLEDFRVYMVYGLKGVRVEGEPSWRQAADHSGMHSLMASFHEGHVELQALEHLQPRRERNLEDIEMRTEPYGPASGGKGAKVAGQSLGQLLVQDVHVRPTPKTNPVVGSASEFRADSAATATDRDGIPK